MSLPPAADASRNHPWHLLVETARWAPSPHNTQPWKVSVIDERHAELFLDRSRALPDEDATGDFLLCAMGIFVEALSIAAAELGTTLVVRRGDVTGRDVNQRTAGSDRLLPVASLRLETSTAVSERFRSRDIRERRTSRLVPKSPPVDGVDLDSMASTASESGMHFGWINDPALIARVVDLNVDAVFHDLNLPAYQREFTSWLRLSRGDEDNTRDGLSARCMNIPSHELRMMRRFPRLFRHPATAPLLRRLYKRRLGEFPQIGYLAGRFFESADGPARSFELGRGTLRFWLAAHCAGVTIHPFGNLITNHSARGQVLRLVGRDDVWIVFRFGRTAQPPRSLRLPTESILCETH